MKNNVCVLGGGGEFSSASYWSGLDEHIIGYLGRHRGGRGGGGGGGGGE